MSDGWGWQTTEDLHLKAGRVMTPPTLPAFADSGSWVVGGDGRLVCSYLPCVASLFVLPTVSMARHPLELIL